MDDHILTLRYADGRTEQFGVSPDLDPEMLEPWEGRVSFSGSNGFHGWAIADGLLWVTVGPEAS